MFQFANAFRSFLGVKLGHTPVVHQLAAAHGVTEVRAPTVGFIDIGHGCGDAAFRHYRVRLAQQGLGDHGNARAGGQSFNCRTQARSARANDQDIMFMGFILRLGRHNILKSLIMPLATMRT